MALCSQRLLYYLLNTFAVQMDAASVALMATPTVYRILFCCQTLPTQVKRQVVYPLVECTCLKVSGWSAHLDMQMVGR